MRTVSSDAKTTLNACPVHHTTERKPFQESPPAVPQRALQNNNCYSSQLGHRNVPVALFSFESKNNSTIPGRMTGLCTLMVSILRNYAGASPQTDTYGVKNKYSVWPSNNSPKTEGPLPEDGLLCPINVTIKIDHMN